MFKKISNLSPIVSYIGATTTYGFIRKCIHMKDATIKTIKYDEKENKIIENKLPILLVDKIQIVLVSTIWSPILSSLYLSNDFKRLELACRDINPEDYEFKDSYYCTSQYYFT